MSGDGLVQDCVGRLRVRSSLVQLSEGPCILRASPKTFFQIDLGGDCVVDPVLRLLHGDLLLWLLDGMLGCCCILQGGTAYGELGKSGSVAR
jgi:hypothetical protein